MEPLLLEHDKQVEEEINAMGDEEFIHPGSPIPHEEQVASGKRALLAEYEECKNEEPLLEAGMKLLIEESGKLDNPADQAVLMSDLLDLPETLSPEGNCMERSYELIFEMGSKHFNEEHWEQATLLYFILTKLDPSNDSHWTALDAAAEKGGDAQKLHIIKKWKELAGRKS